MFKLLGILIGIMGLLIIAEVIAPGAVTSQLPR